MVVAVWFDLHARSLGAYAARRVGSTLARDIVAETFRVAWEQREQYDANLGGQRAWLFGIATNLICRHWRAEWGGWGSNPRPTDYESPNGRPCDAKWCHLAGGCLHRGSSGAIR